MFVLEIRNTGNWEDCRYRRYTTSERKADEFKSKVKRISFTDSGHGLVPFVRTVSKKLLPSVSILEDHVKECLSNNKGPVMSHPAPYTCKHACERDALKDTIETLVSALEGVIRVADRETVEFDAAREAIAKARAQSQ